MKEQKSKKNDITKPIAISAGLHAVLIAALLFGTDFTMSKPEPAGNMVQAVVIDPQLVRQQAQEIRNQREAAAKKEQARLDKLRRESEQLEKSRKAEEERIRKLKEQQAREAKAAREAEQQRIQREKERKAEEARVKKEREQAAKLEAERKKKEAAIRKAEEERLAKEAAIAKAEKERIAKEKAAQEAKEKAERAEKERIAKEKAAKEAAEKARKEKERLERLERERKEQEAALNDIFAGLESEAAQNSSARAQYVSSETDRYGAIYTQLIQQNLLIEDSFRGKSCRVNLRLIPTGAGAIVGELNILDGDNRLCAAAKRAVAQVGTFPLPKDEPDVVEKLKNINLTVVPE
ncbi:cell envelope integrity protein TolA [Vibrio sp. SCSIO 43135]|uniref:cell envelope integrity protein TolA n=1 Tax=Vibrio sp. SCSIO 43135 TaxID=2819096 RepID=UPI002076633B|nr:cell envelope integrity protein TolA [Vibrio sp. SCSIO 43135]USD42131.1 cell envelope integrity protein TolA [Vibrio sp. SCSIO 43135]